MEDVVGLRNLGHRRQVPLLEVVRVAFEAPEGTVHGVILPDLVQHYLADLVERGGRAVAPQGCAQPHLRRVWPIASSRRGGEASTLIRSSGSVQGFGWCEAGTIHGSNNQTKGVTVEGTRDKVEGKLKETEGKLTDDKLREKQGEAQQKVGEGKEKLEDAKDEARDRI